MSSLGQAKRTTYQEPPAYSTSRPFSTAEDVRGGARRKRHESQSQGCIREFPRETDSTGEKARGLIWEWAPTEIDCKPPLQTRKQGCGFVCVQRLKNKGGCSEPRVRRMGSQEP